MADPIVYPESLPCPVAAPLQSEERRLLSSLDGPRQSRPFSRDRLAGQAVEFFFTHEEVAVFNAWVKDDLVNGAAWFASDWPLPQGGIGVRRFVGVPSFPVYYHTVGWRVRALCQVRGRGELPNLYLPDPFLVSAFDFETGLVDMANPSRVMGGSISADTVNFLNGTQSASLAGARYFWTPVSSDFGFGVGDFGIEFYAYLPDPPGSQAIDLFALNGVFNLYNNGSFQTQNEPLNTSIGLSPANVNNVWQHYFVGRRAGVFYTAKNGSINAPGFYGPNVDTAYDVGSTGYLVIGNRNPSSSALFSGVWSVDRIRVYKGSCPYVADFTPETGLYPS